MSTYITFEISEPLSFIQGSGADAGGQGLPMFNLPGCKIKTELTKWLDGSGSVEFYSFVIAFADTMQAWNIDGNPSNGGTGGYVVLYESDDAPSVWQVTRLGPESQFLATQTFAEVVNFILTDGKLPLSSLEGCGLPAPF